MRSSPSQTATVSLPGTMLEQLDQAAEKVGATRSELFRAAMREYLAKLEPAHGPVSKMRTSVGTGQQNARIKRLAQTLGFTSIKLIGSAARGDARKDSDVDFLVTARKGLRGAGYFAAMDRLRVELERVTGREVDVIDVDAVNSPKRLAKLQREAKPL